MPVKLLMTDGYGLGTCMDIMPCNDFSIHQVLHVDWLTNDETQVAVWHRFSISSSGWICIERGEDPPWFWMLFIQLGSGRLTERSETVLYKASNRSYIGHQTDQF